MTTSKTNNEYYEEAKQLIESVGGEIISRGYISSHDKIKFKCNCTNEYSLSLIQLRSSKGFCPICRYDRSISNKYNTENVKEIFSDNDCILLSEYIENGCLLVFKCKCGREDKKTLTAFFKHSECKECTKENKIKNKLEKSYKKASYLLKQNGCEMKTSLEDYLGTKNVVKFICKCGRESEKRWDILKKHFQCNLCAQENIGKASLISYDNICEYIISKNCKIITLQEEYKNTSQVIDIECSCGNNFKTSFINFKHENKTRCNECVRKSVTGENHPFWKGGMSESGRNKIPGYNIWRNGILKKGGYECVCCGSKKDLKVHHIRNFSEEEDLRLNDDNGVILCDNCHNPSKYGSFHYLYGTRNNNENQLSEYITDYKNGAFGVMRLANLLKPDEKISKAEKNKMLKNLMVFEIIPLNKKR